MAKDNHVQLVDTPKTAKKLTKEQVEERGKDLAETVGALDKLKAKHKDQKSKMKEKEVELQSKITRLATEVESGEEMVDSQLDLLDA